MNIHNCKLFYFITYSKQTYGSLTTIENSISFPFDFKRIYYLHGVPLKTKRGVHAHKKLEQFIIAISGSFDITIDDGINSKTFHMNDPTQGLYICPMIWREIENFSKDAVLMVLASTKYDPDDYIHDYEEFLAYKKTL